MINSDYLYIWDILIKNRIYLLTVLYCLLQYICKYKRKWMCCKVQNHLWMQLLYCTWPVWLFDSHSWREKNIPEYEDCVRTDRSDEKPLKKHTHVCSHSSSSIHTHKRVEKEIITMSCKALLKNLQGCLIWQHFLHRISKWRTGNGEQI